MPASSYIIRTNQTVAFVTVTKPCLLLRSVSRLFSNSLRCDGPRRCVSFVQSVTLMMLTGLSPVLSGSMAAYMHGFSSTRALPPGENEGTAHEFDLNNFLFQSYTRSLFRAHRTRVVPPHPPFQLASSIRQSEAFLCSSAGLSRKDLNALSSRNVLIIFTSSIYCLCVAACRRT